MTWSCNAAWRRLGRVAAIDSWLRRSDRILELATALPLARGAAALVDAARLRSGALQDEVAVIVAG